MEKPPLTSNEVMFGKGKRNLEAALRLLGNDAKSIDAKTLDDACTMALVAVRLLQRLAGRIDMPRADPVPKAVKKKKQAAPPPMQTPAKSARRGSPTILDVSGAEEKPTRLRDRSKKG